MITFPKKDPEESLDFTVDFTDWLVAPATLSLLGGDTTVVQDGTSIPGALTNCTITNITTTSTKVTFTLSSGTVGEQYKFKVKVKDNSTPQRIGVRRAKIKIALK